MSDIIMSLSDTSAGLSQVGGKGRQGEVKVNWDVKDQDREDYALTFFILEEGKDMVDLMASTIQPGLPSWSNMVFLQGAWSWREPKVHLLAERGHQYLRHLLVEAARYSYRQLRAFRSEVECGSKHGVEIGC